MKNSERENKQYTIKLEYCQIVEGYNEQEAIADFLNNVVPYNLEYECCTVIDVKGTM